MMDWFHSNFIAEMILSASDSDYLVSVLFLVSLFLLLLKLVKRILIFNFILLVIISYALIVRFVF